MNRFKKHLMFILLLVSVTAMAQNKSVEITGTVIDKELNEPVEQANVRLLNAKDSAYVKGTASGKNGFFSIKTVKPGSYIVQISYIGYTTVDKNLLVTGKNATVNVGKVEMSDEGILLSEAVVVGKAAEVVVRNDTVEYNAESFKVAEGSALEEMLKKMPGVEIDKDGKITVNGKEVKKMLVDGKEFFSDDPKVASKNLPAKMVDKVQVLDKKSDMAMMTGFDDGEEQTVINLTVKPGMKKGWFGNAFAGYGSQDRYEGHAMLNRFVESDQLSFIGGINNTNNMGFSDNASSMFQGMGGGGRRMRFGGGNGITSSGNAGLNFNKELNPKFSLGGNTRYGETDNKAKSKSNVQNFLKDSTSYYNEINNNYNKTDNFGLDLRMDWKPDSMTNIIFTPAFTYSKNVQEETGYFETLSGLKDTVNIGNSNYYSRGESTGVNALLDFSRKLNSKGRVLSFSLSGGLEDSYNRGTNLSETDFLLADSVSTIDQEFRYDNKSYNYRAYASFVEPIGRNNFLQLTYSYSQRHQESIRSTYSKDADGIYNVLDTAYSKSYANDFINQRIRFSFKSVREKFDYTVGINVDPSYTKSRNFVGDSTLTELSRSVTNVSPIAQFNYRFDKRTNLRVDYVGRVQEPSLTQLNPIEDISNPLNTTVGNPDLNPKYVNTLNVRFQKFLPEKQTAFMLFASADYTVNDIVSYATYNNETGKRLTTYKNVNGNWGTNARGIFNMPLRNQKFTVNSHTFFRFSNMKGYVNADENTTKNLSLSERAGINFRSKYFDFGLSGSVAYSSVVNSFQENNDRRTFNYNGAAETTVYLPWDIRVESDINYATNSGYADGFKQKEWLWNASVSKELFKQKNGTVRFKIYDILKQRSNIVRSVTAESIQDTEYNTLNSYFMVYFVYRFSIFKGGAAAPSGRDQMRSMMRGHRH
ncbi:MAG: outer membrane beta-barrel protein [Tannerellaceae bacterium]